MRSFSDYDWTTFFCWIVIIFAGWKAVELAGWFFKLAWNYYAR